MRLKLVVMVGSVRSDRQGMKAARFVERSLVARGHEVTVVDPLVGAIAAAGLHLQGIREEGRRRPFSKNLPFLPWAADAFVVVSAEDNDSIPPALSNFLHYFLEEYFFRPSAIVCYSAGSFGGVRAAMQLRAMLCELGMPSISSLFPVPTIREALDENGIAKDANLNRRFERFAVNSSGMQKRFTRRE